MPNDLPDFRVHHLALSVPDIEASIIWFAEKLGFVEEVRRENPAIPAKIVFMRRGDLRVELFEVSGAAPLPDDRRELVSDLRTHGTKHIAFEVAYIDRFVDELLQRGVDIASCVERDWAKIAFVRDNAGNLLEFLELKNV